MTQYDTFADGIGLTTLESPNGEVDSLNENTPIAVNGVAIPENTILEGGLGEPHFYSPQMAERAAEVLQSQIDDPETNVHIVKNFHETEGQAEADDIIGVVTGAGYSPGIGTVFEGEVMDEKTAQKINHGYLNISPSVARSLGQFDETMQARGVEEVAGFRDIATVGNGQPGAGVQTGPNPAVEALSRAALSEETETDTMSLEEAKQTIADEYGLETDEIEARLTNEPDEPDEIPDGHVRLVAAE